MARHDNDFELVRLALLLATILNVSACDFTSRSTESHLPPFVKDHQAAKQKIIDDCYERPETSRPKYIEEWDREALDRAKNKDIKYVVPQLAKAGCLLELDPRRYQDYYAYVNSHLDDDNWEVAATAATALRGAKGRESIDRLALMVKGDHPLIAGNAVSSIAYRVTTSLYDQSSKDDREYAMGKLQELCANPDSARGLRRVCQQNDLIKK